MATIFSSESTNPLFLFISIALPLLVFVAIKLSSAKSRRLPPGPSPWPVIGNLLQVGPNTHVALAELAQKHGPLISLKLGTQLVIVGSSPEAAAGILKTNDRVLSGRHVAHVSFAKSPARNHVSLGFTYDCSDQWKFLRARCRGELFGSNVIETQSGIREKCVLDLVGFLGSKQGEAVRIREAVFASGYNSLSTVLMSKAFISLDEAGIRRDGMDGLRKKVVDLFTRPNVSDLYPFLGWLDLQGLKREAEKVMNQIFMAWEGIIREKRKRKESGDLEKPADFLDVLLEYQFTDDQINGLFLELFVAGTDTSTSTIEWAMAELMKNPEAMDKLREELDQEIPAGEAVKESHLHNLSYLHACVKETLRLHPPAPLLLARRALESCQVMGYTIPKNSQILVNVWAIGRDAGIWEDPLAFKPERFLDSSLDFKGNDFEFLPFGAGRRICPGLSMGIRQTHLSVANLVYHFEWSLPHNMLPHQLDMAEKFGITMEKEQPLMAIPKPRR